MLEMLKDITKIPRTALDEFKVNDFCVAEKMSWSGHRNTTREEDRAYCLLGVFNVSMPLLYGEGEKAFQKFQEEIMGVSTDLSLFLWQGYSCSDFGMLAATSSCFMDIPDEVRSTDSLRLTKLLKGWDTNNAGISLKVCLDPYTFTSTFEEIFVLYLHAPFGPDQHFGIGIFVEREDRSREDSSYRRVVVDGRTWIQRTFYRLEPLLPFRPTLRQVLITRKPLEKYEINGDRGFDLRFSSQKPCKCICRNRPVDDPVRHPDKWPLVQESSSGSLNCSVKVKPIHASGIIGLLIITVTKNIDLLLCMGFDHFFRPICVIVPFWTQSYQGGLGVYDILRTYNILLGDTADGGEARDPETQIVAVCGLDGMLDFSTEYPDLYLEVMMNHGGWDGSYTTTIDFDADAFTQELGLKDTDTEEFEVMNENVT